MELEELKEKYSRKLHKELNLSVFEKAAKTFFLPFNKSAFDSLVTAALCLLATLDMHPGDY